MEIIYKSLYYVYKFKKMGSAFPPTFNSVLKFRADSVIQFTLVVSLQQFLYYPAGGAGLFPNTFLTWALIYNR